MGGIDYRHPAPDLETRCYLRKKANWNLQVPDESLEYIAHRITSNIRELEGALTRLLAYAQLHNAPITMELTQEACRIFYRIENLNL